eukprot:Sro599_g173130.2  (211) ;mRNA; r:6366-6998
MALLPIADPQQRELRERVGQCLWESLRQACGGNFLQDDDERQHVRDSCRSSICFPNKTKNSVDGKPQDLEIRLALSLFHRWKRQQQQHGKSTTIIIVTSDMGLQRQISSPLELAALWVLPLEVGLRNAGIAHDVQCHSSGLIGIVTLERSLLLRQHGRLPCPQCPKWCLGTKGLWWHQQQCHSIEHSEPPARRIPWPWFRTLLKKALPCQ